MALADKPLVTPEQRRLIAELDRRHPGWDRRRHPRQTPDRRKREEKP